jgi:AcrR family transcriptional regulator
MTRTRAPTQSRRRASARPIEGPRERLLNVADDLFYRRGIRNVGIDEIIATAGVAKASLYNHFASKDELVAEYVRRRGAEWWAWFRAAVETRATTPEGQLLAVFDVLIEWVGDARFRGCALQNAGIELADPAHPAHLSVVTSKRAARAFLARLATDAGYRKPKAVAEQLALLFEGAIITALLEGSVAPARTARTAAAVLLQRS